jgi:hypothetical protein
VEGFKKERSAEEEEEESCKNTIEFKCRYKLGK